jgi:hypothetical protein
MLKTVEFLQTTSKGQKLVGTVSFDGEKVQFKVPLGLELQMQGGIKGRSENGILYPEDGFKFLEELQFAFSGSYLRATKPKEGIIKIFD